ncbi:MAG: hypothetical protein IKK36_08935 [Bacteroidales bacterium]|nr:hypothetical protein [Bacteroidales bacterium]
MEFFEIKICIIKITHKMKLKFIVALTILAAIMTSCATHKNGIYSDVIGFSSKVESNYLINHKGRFKNLFRQMPPVNLTDSEDTAYFHRCVGHFPEELRKKDSITSNTALYYAVETACDRIRYIRKRYMKGNKETQYYIFATTDGLDNWSSQAALEDGQTLFRVKPNKYPKRVQRKLKRAMGWSKNQFEVYPMVKDGQDLRTIQEYNNMEDEEYVAYIDSIMDCLRYSSKGKEKAPEVIFKDNYDTIFSTVKEKFKTSSFSFLVPKGYSGERIRMLLTSDTGESAELTGLFHKKIFKYVLSDIELNGITINRESIYFKKDGKTLFPSANNLKAFQSGAVKFKIEKIESLIDGKKFDVNKEVVKQYHETNGIWAQNTEYRKESLTTQNVYFIFVVDASASLSREDFDAEMEMVKSISHLMEDVE